MNTKEEVERDGEVRLLPCPFCGSNKVVWSEAFRRVRCNSCYIGTPNAGSAIALPRDVEALKMRAFKEWNARSFPSEADKKLLGDLYNDLRACGWLLQYLEPLKALIERLNQ